MIMLENTCFDIILAFSNTSTFLLILLAGFFLLNRAIFYQAACLSAFGLVINIALKGSFKVPLPAHLGPYYAFPSGHMQSSSIFYLWLALYISFLPLRMFVALLLPGIGAGLIYYHYHTLYEVLGGLFFAFMTIALYRYLIIKFKNKSALLILLIASLLMVYNTLIYEKLPSHAWPAYMILMALLCLKDINKNSGFVDSFSRSL